jgi:AraC-like DNA-binding protein
MPGQMMQIDYLERHPLLQTTDLDAARALVGRLWTEPSAERIGPDPFGVITRHVPLAKTGLAFVRWTPVEIRGEYALPRYLLVLHETGAGEHRLNGRRARATPQQAVFLAPEQRQELTIGHCRSFALHFQRPFVDHALERRFAHWPPLHEWAREFPIDRGPGATLKSLVRWTAMELDQPDCGLMRSPKAIAHLEAALRSLLVECLAPLYPVTAPEKDTTGPAYLRPLEEWMEANLGEPIAIEHLAEVAGVGVRTVQAAFRRYRGCSPMARLQTMRMHRARALLLHPLPGTSVTAVALGIGLLHLGRFSTRYRDMFGESPSETLVRGMRGW